jgi:poly-gamma-glutamate capsule biosynthesis protein CapA/YwtB (metallophosphatase superfamily)
VPTVFVVHHSRGRVEATSDLVNRIVNGRVATWRPLDGSSDRLRVGRTTRDVTGDPSAVAVIPAVKLSPWVRAAVVDGVDPTQRPPTGTGPVTTLRVVGDIMLGRGVAAANPGRDPVAPLRPLRRHLAGADLTVGNLESTLSDDGQPRQGGDSFAAPQDVAAGLADLGFDAVSLANNHTGDFGEGALLDTLRVLHRSRLATFGAGADLAAASQAVALARSGIRFGFIGFNAIGETPRATGDTPGALSIRMPPRTGPLNEADLTHVERLVRRLRHRVDVVVVIPHWGAQYTHVPVPAQSSVARRLAAAGADLVAGGHPHWVQGLERAGDAVVAHSLGNLVFDMDFAEQTMQGVTLTATFWGKRLVGVELAPYRLDARFAPRLIDGPAAQDVLDDVWAASTGPFSGP